MKRQFVLGLCLLGTLPAVANASELADAVRGRDHAAIKTLLAARRHLNFTRAADELGLTPAAVSHQIKEIEDQLGAILFHRAGRSLRLTEAGTIFCDAAEDSIETLTRAASRIQKLSRGSTALRISVPVELATKWLMLKVVQFRRLNPSIDLRFDIQGAIPTEAVERAIALSRAKYCSVFHSFRQDIAFSTSVYVTP